MEEASKWLDLKMCRKIEITMIVVLCLSVAYSILESFDWPIMQDAALFQYVAQRFLAGDVPYKSIFEMNTPGIYLIHMFELKLFGETDIAWRIYDLFWSIIIASGMFLFCRKGGIRIGLIVALMYLNFHIARGPLQMGQRDFFMSAFLIWGILFFVHSIEKEQRRYLIISGIIFGIGATVKPTAIFLIAGITLLFLIYGMISDRKHFVSAIVFGTASSLPIIGIFIWLYTQHSVDAFLECTFQFIPLFKNIHQQSMGSLISVIGHSSFRYVPGVVLIPLIARSRWFPTLRFYAILVGICFGVANFFVQGKGYPYHIYPFHCFAILLLPTLYPFIFRTTLFIRTIGIFLLGISVLYIVYQSSVVPQQRPNRPLNSELLSAELIGVGIVDTDKIQTLGSTSDGVGALYRLHLRLPTRYMYGFHYYLDTTNTLIRNMREEFFVQIKANPPRLFVIVGDSGLINDSMLQIRLFPVFASFLSRNYELIIDSPNHYLIYKRNQMNED